MRARIGMNSPGQGGDAAVISRSAPPIQSSPASVAYTRSKMAAIPCPPPMHIVTSP
jgi:hypothetical protein